MVHEAALAGLAGGSGRGEDRPRPVVEAARGEAELLDQPRAVHARDVRQPGGVGAQRDLGVDVPDGVIEDYERVATQVDLDSIRERERVTRHDVKARIEEFCALGGHEHIHKGMTSRDLTENVEQLQVRQSLELLRDRVVAALARALQLTAAERDHLYRLAGLAPPADGEVSDHIPPGMQRVLHRLGDAAAAVFAADWQLIWWNRGWASLLGDPSVAPPAQRNFARDTFPVDAEGPRLSQWPVTSLAGDAVEAAVVSDLRRATIDGSGVLPQFTHPEALVALLG